MFNTPILFLIFNRPDTTQIVFNKIKDIKPKYLYVAADGPRSKKEGEVQKCKQTRDIIDQVDWDCEIKTLFRESNLGCKKAVSEAITWFFKNVEQGIILEDDCLPADSFFAFAENLLEKYKDDNRIMCISGENPLEPENFKESYYFSKIPHIWGWASWRRAWDLYDVEFNNFDEFISNNAIQNVFKEKEVQKYWNKIFSRVKNGEINTWDYQWTYALFINNGLSIIPSKNMISNIGFGHAEACHTSENADCADRITYEIDDIIHPEFMISDEESINKILKIRYDIHKKTVPFLFKRELSRIIKKLK